MRRSRSDTLPLVAQPVAPRVVTVGLDCDEVAAMRTLVVPSELLELSLKAGRVATIAAHEPHLVCLRACPETIPLVRELKLLPETHFIPVVACGAPEMRLPAYAAGADHWTDVPFPADELRTRAGALLRTAALSRALKQSRQELRLRRDWVRYLVHDLRNLLTKAIGDVAMATRKTAADPSAAGELMARCEEELWRCSALLNDLVDVDRIRKGMLNLRLQPTDLVALTRRSTETFAAVAQRARVEIITRTTEPEVLALVDAAIVERIIANLISNALHYAPECSSITIDLRADPRSRLGLVEVENRGPSIPPDKVDEIFEPFVRADDGHAVGSGLGLAFCRLTVELHGGRIHVSEPAGGGARFTVELPLSTS